MTEDCTAHLCPKGQGVKYILLSEALGTVLESRLISSRGISIAILKIRQKIQNRFVSSQRPL